MKITKESQLGNIVTKIPKASKVFNAYNLDNCCGGNQTIEHTYLERNIDFDKILVALNKLIREVDNFKENRDFNNMSNIELIEYTVSIHHSYLNQHLPIISELSNNVLRYHGTNYS